MSARIFRVEVDGQRAYCSEIGEGPPIVLLASMVVLERTYRRTAQRLAEQYRVITVELPGSGRASKLTTLWSFEEYATWLEKLIGRLGLNRPPIIIGHSNSGAVALIFAVMFPERISKRVLVDSIGANAVKSVARVVLARGIDGIIELKLTLSAFHHVVYNALFHTRSFLCQIKRAARSDLLEYASRLSVPTVIAWGRWDLTMPARCANALHRAAPDSRLYISRSGSHDWVVTNPSEFAELLI